MLSIDLNADLGEHPNSNLDELIMPFISSCNIACGGHIGNEISVRKTVRLAKQHGVAVGAHPSYPDPENFGRKIMEMQPKDLAESISTQIQLVQRICEEEGVEMHHVKPHGALYNQAAANEFISQLIYLVLADTSPDAYWMGLANSLSEKTALKHGHPFIAEGFADRQYEPDGSLRSRSMEGAVLDRNQVIKQVEELAMNQRVMAGGWLDLKVQSICLHGDKAGAVSLAKEINQHLATKGIKIAAV